MALTRNQESESNPTEKEMRDKINLLQDIAFEKCRMFRKSLLFPNHNPNIDDFIWSQKECKDASNNVVEQLNELHKMKYGK